MGAEQSSALPGPAGHLPTGNLLCEGRGMAGACVSERRAEPRGRLSKQPVGMVLSKPHPHNPVRPNHGHAPHQSPVSRTETSGPTCFLQQQELTVARAKAFSNNRSSPLQEPRTSPDIGPQVSPPGQLGAATCQSSSPARPSFATPTDPPSVAAQQGGTPASASRHGSVERNIVPPSSRLALPVTPRRAMTVIMTLTRSVLLPHWNPC